MTTDTLVERLQGQASAHRYMGEMESAALLEEAVAALQSSAIPSAEFDNPLVQRVYRILTDEANPPVGEHWEGFVARRIVSDLLRGEGNNWHSPAPASSWTHLSKILPIIQKAAQGLWGWSANSRCKYVEMRVDTRDGTCLLYDRYRMPLTVEEFADQCQRGTGRPWPYTVTSGENIKADRQYLAELAAHFDGSPVPEIKAHRQRLITIANKLV